MNELVINFIITLLTSISVYFALDKIKSVRANPNILLSNPFYQIENRGTNYEGNQVINYQGVILNAGNRPSFVRILHSKVKGYESNNYFITKKIGTRKDDNKELGGLGDIILEPGETRKVNITIEWYIAEPTQNDYELVIPVKFTDKNGKWERKDRSLKLKLGEKSPDRPI